MKDNVRAKNIEIRVIKWERVWNDYRKGRKWERESGREQRIILATTAIWVVEESRAANATKEKTRS